MIKICIVAGARPNFMKVAPIVKELGSSDKIEYFLVHTGQHYDKNMSDQFFEDLEIGKPDIFLGVGSGSHAVQTAEVMKRFENVVLERKPEVIIVVGDVNSTLACALVASKILYDSNGSRPLIAHVEAGLRSFDRSMPEEVNRVLTDHISDFLFITEGSGKENLLKEGIEERKIYFVGNVMIDSLLKNRSKAEKSNILNNLGLVKKQVTDPSKKMELLEGLSTNLTDINDYAVLTLHRPSNVDNKHNFTTILEALKEISKKIPIVFPTHPRTLNWIKEFKLEEFFNIMVNDLTYKVIKEKINCIGPLAYIDFLQLMSKSKLVLTDSGGVQEETTILGVPCITIRENTERPVTISHGTNRLAGTKKNTIIEEGLRALQNVSSEFHVPPLWDGNAAKRIVEILMRELSTDNVGSIA